MESLQTRIRAAVPLVQTQALQRRNPRQGRQAGVPNHCAVESQKADCRQLFVSQSARGGIAKAGVLQKPDLLQTVK